MIEALPVHSQLWLVCEYCPGGSVKTLVSRYLNYLCVTLLLSSVSPATDLIARFPPLRCTLYLLRSRSFGEVEGILDSACAKSAERLNPNYKHEADDGRTAIDTEAARHLLILAFPAFCRMHAVPGEVEDWLNLT